ncbi:uncharacterized protein P884DRAFT_258416, partial [Thermothelomyces heterothallicus CBS 202.75]|uniref:uncharacterized protein n=1 Tax=Thermothelomyces heterothallicus CBS 202.75 TaxID=1149848 RepID=UPI003743DC14
MLNQVSAQQTTVSTAIASEESLMTISTRPNTMPTPFRLLRPQRDKLLAPGLVFTESTTTKAHSSWHGLAAEREM